MRNVYGAGCRADSKRRVPRKGHVVRIATNAVTVRDGVCTVRATVDETTGERLDKPLVSSFPVVGMGNVTELLHDETVQSAGYRSRLILHVAVQQGKSGIPMSAWSVVEPRKGKLASLARKLGFRYLAALPGPTPDTVHYVSHRSEKLSASKNSMGDVCPTLLEAGCVSISGITEEALAVLKTQAWFKGISEIMLPLPGNGDVRHVARKPNAKRSNRYFNGPDAPYPVASVTSVP